MRPPQPQGWLLLGLLALAISIGIGIGITWMTGTQSRNDALPPKDKLAAEKTAGTGSTVLTGMHAPTHAMTSSILSSPGMDNQIHPNRFQKRLLKDATLLDQRLLPPTHGGLTRQIRLWRTGFKYPLVREEIWYDPSNSPKTSARLVYEVADHVMVRFPAGLDEEAIREWAVKNGFYIRHSLKTTSLKLIAVPNADLDSIERMLSAFKASFPESADPQVAVAEPDSLVFPALAPDDVSFDKLWGLHNTGQTGGTPDADIDAPEAWNITTGSREVLVGVIDTGVDRMHPDLAANMWTNPHEIPGNGLDDDGNGFVDDVHGWDFFSGDNNPMDEDSHGTHCAGIIGAVGNNRAGVTGVCWQVSMVGIRFLGPDGGTTSDAIESIHYATSLGVDITSNSWGGAGMSNLLQQAVEDAGAQEILFVAAAGNDGTDNDISPFYPANFSSNNLISVAATGAEDIRAGFSNYGRTSVDIAAPGSLIYSTIPGAGFATLSGTSMAAPHVASAAALARSIAPLSTARQLKQSILDTADPVGALTPFIVTGARLNAGRLIEETAGPYPVLAVTAIQELPGGNGDGIQNPGETLAIEFTITNRGTQSATSIFASIASSTGEASRYELIERTVEIDSLQAGESTSAGHHFIVRAHPDVVTPYAEEMIITVRHGAPEQIQEQRFNLRVYTSSLIAGRVTDLEDGAGLPQATVVMQGPSVITLITNDDGDYQTTVTDGQYAVSARAPGYLESNVQGVAAPPGRSDVDFALGRPQLRLTPDALSVEALSGDIVQREVLITNHGSASLEWSLGSRIIKSLSTAITLPAHQQVSIKTPDQDFPQVPLTSSLPEVMVPLNDLSDVIIGAVDTTQDRSVFLKDLRSRGATVITLYPPLTTASLAGMDAIILDDTLQFLSLNDMQNLRAAIQNGTGLLCEADNVASLSNAGTLLRGTGISPVADVFRDLTLTDIVPHPITVGVSLLRQIAAGWSASLSGIAQPLVREPDGRVHAAVSKLGRGIVVFVGNEITDASNFAIGDGRRFASQIMDGLLEGATWLQVTPQTGILAPAAQQTITLTLDAGKAGPGTHQAALSVTSNIPDEPGLVVPITLQVQQRPELVLSSPSVVFGEVIEGTSASQELIVSNLGTADLVIAAPILSGAASFTVQLQESITLPPLGHAIIRVYFRPQSALGLQEAILKLTSNDPRLSSVDVPLTGTAVAAPAVVLTPKSNLALKLSQGRTASRVFTVRNTGKGPLRFQPSLSFPEGKSSDWVMLEDSSEQILAPGKSTQITLHFHARDHSQSIYFAQFQLTSDDPSQTLLVRDLALTIRAAPVPSFDSLAFEKTYIGESQVQTLTIVNAGADDLVLRSARSLHAALRPVLKVPAIVPPGGALQIPVTYSPRTVGDLTSTLVFSANVPGLSIRVPVTGIGARHPRVRVTPAKLTLRSAPGVPLTRTLKVTNLGGEELDWHIMPTPAESTWFHSLASSSRLGAREKGEVSVTFSTAQLPAGTYTSAIRLQTSDPLRPEVTVPITLTVTSQAVLEATPAAQDLGEVWLGHPAHLHFALTNVGNLPMEIRNVTSLSKDLVFPWNETITLAPGQAHSLFGTLTASKLKPFKSLISVRSNSQVRANLKLPITATVVAPPQISVTPTLIVETLAPNIRQEEQILITNNGGALLEWTAEVLPASKSPPTSLENAVPLEEEVPSWLLVQNEGSVLASSSSPMSLHLIAQGLEAGVYTAHVRLTNNDPDTPQVDIPVSLTVSAAAIFGVSSKDITFPATPANGTSSQTLALRNEGNLPLTIRGITTADPAFQTTPAVNLPLTLAPGEDLNLMVQFTPFEARAYNSRLTVISDVEGQGETVIALSGLGLPAPLLKLTPEAVVITTRPGVPASQPITLENTGSAPLVWNFTSNLSTGFLNPVSGTIPPGSIQVITLTSYSTASTPPGGSVQSITLNSNDPVRPVIGIPYTRNILAEPTLLVSPSSIGLGTLYLPGGTQRQITLRNMGNANLLVSSVQLPSSSIILPADRFPLWIAPDGAESFTLEFAPSSPEVLLGSVVFTTNNPITPDLMVPVTGQATIPPTLTLAPASVERQLEEGGSLLTPLTLTNDGGSILSWSATVTPTSARKWLTVDQASGSVSAGMSSQIGLTLNAGSLAPSSLSATLTLTTNVPGATTVTVPISLLITPGEFSLSAESIESSTVVSADSPGSVLSVIPRTGSSPPWTLSSNVPWITPSVTSGTGEAAITLSYATTLREGTHTGQITVSTSQLTRVVQVTRHVIRRQFSLLQTDRRHDRVLGLVRGAGGNPSLLVAIHAQTLAVQQVLALPSDITSVDLSTDERTLYAISFAGRSITRVHLDDFTLVATKGIPITADVGTFYHVQAGREGRVYYTDATANPALHVYDFDAGADVAEFRLSGLRGIGSFTVTPDAGTIYARSQTGWGESGTSLLACVDCSSDVLRETSASSATLAQDSTFHPVLVGANLDEVITQRNFFTTSDLAGGVQGRLTADLIFNASAYHDLFVNATQLIRADGSLAENLPVRTTVTAFSPDQSRLIYQDPVTGNQGIVDTSYLPPIAVVPDIVPGSTQNVTLNMLSWSGDPGVATYDVFLDTDADAVANAEAGGPLTYLTSLSATRYALPLGTLLPGQTYYWRVDSRTAPDVVTKGPIWNFKMAQAGATPNLISGHAMSASAPVQSAPLTLITAGQGTSWTLSSDSPWVRVSQDSGTGPAVVTVFMDPAGLASGASNASLSLVTGADVISIPVRFDVMGPLNIIKMKADPLQPVVHALHRETAAPYLSWLLWVDPLTAEIQDGVMVGNAAVDFTAHATDNRLYALVEDGRRVQMVERQGTHALLNAYALPTPQVAIHAGTAGRIITFSAANSLQLRAATSGEPAGSPTQVLGRGSHTVASTDGVSLYAAVSQSASTIGLVRYAVTGTGVVFATANYFSGSLQPPLLRSTNGSHLVHGGQSFSLPEFDLTATFEYRIHAISPSGSRLVSDSAIYSRTAPTIPLADLPAKTTQMAITADGETLLLFSPARRSFQSVKMP